MRRILEATVDHPLFPLLATTFYTAARNSEVRALEWSLVDFERGVIHVRCDEIFTPKSRKSRAMPLERELRGILAPLARGNSVAGEDSLSVGFPSSCDGADQIAAAG